MNALTMFRKYKPSLEEAQELVGGYVELIKCNDCQLLVNAEGRILRNEDGLLKKLPFNPQASLLAGQSIVGPAVALFGSARWLPSD